MKNKNYLFLFLIIIFVTKVYLFENDKILLSDLKSFTVYKDRKTKGRRSEINQLECVEGDACEYYQVESMQCTQAGFDGSKATWKCKTQLDDYYFLGYTKVSCEGYQNPDDIYITRDSCGVRYSLYLTEKGKEFYSESSTSSVIVIIVTIAIFVFAGLWVCFSNSDENNNYNERVPSNDDDQPPPYGSWNDEENLRHRTRENESESEQYTAYGYGEGENR